MTTARLLSPRSASLALPERTTVNGAPSLRWPSERHLTPSHCGHCGTRLLVSTSDIPTATDPRHDVSCLLCTRVAVKLTSDSLRERIPSRDLSIDPPARMGRPPGARPGPVRPSGRPCADCSGPVTGEARRCAECEQVRRLNEGIQGKLLAILERGGEPLHHSELAALLAVSHDSLRNAIRNARRRGYLIVRSKGGRYSLEEGVQS